MYLSDLFIPSAERAATAGVCRDGRSQGGSQTPSVCYTGMLTYYLQPHSTGVSECLKLPLGTTLVCVWRAWCHISGLPDH